MQLQRYGTLLILLSVPLAGSAFNKNTAPPAFTVEQILGFPSPDNLVASPVGSQLRGRPTRRHSQHLRRLQRAAADHAVW